MADITMCDDIYCPRKTICLRYCGKPSDHQSWFAISPRDRQDCSEFIEMPGVREKQEPQEISLFQSGGDSGVVHHRHGADGDRFCGP